MTTEYLDQGSTGTADPYADQLAKLRPYPGFTRDDLAGELAEGVEPPERIEQLAEQLVCDSTYRHEDGHQKYTHPFCHKCDHRLNDGAPELRAMRWLILHNGRAPAEVDLREHVDLADYALTPSQLHALPDPKWIVDGIVTENVYALIAGRKSTMKSFVTMSLACSVATGEPWCGRNVKQRKVLYLVGEGASGTKKRQQAWEGHYGITVPDENLKVLPLRVSLFTDAGTESLIDYVQREGFGLIIIDTLRRYKGAATENSDEMGTVIDNVDRVKASMENGSVIVIHHTGKSEGADSRGHSSIEDDADIVWYTSRSKHDKYHVQLVNEKMKDESDGEEVDLLALASNDSLVISADRFSTPDQLSLSQKQVMTAMHEYYRNADVSATELMDVLGMSSTTFYRVINELVKEGKLIREGKRPAYIRLTRANTASEGDIDEEPLF